MSSTAFHVDRGILDCVLGRLGLRGWFKTVFFNYHADVRLRFLLASGFGEAKTTDGDVPQVCPLRIVFFIVELYLPWCPYLERVPGVTPQLYADFLT